MTGSGLARTETTGISFDQYPLLIIYDTGSDAHDASDDDYFVVIDLGGDDSYTGRAAGADGTLRVLLDVSGNDTYSYLQISSTDPVVAQGAGSAGVGVLVDGGGDDVYSVSATGTPGSSGENCDSVGSTATTIAQGGAVLGAGVLVDLGGSDHRDCVATSHGSPASTYAQGGALLGVAALVDDSAAAVSPDSIAGAAGDENAARAISLLHQANPNLGCIGSGRTVAQGGGDLGGAGAFGDAMGDDVLTLSAEGGAGTVIGQGGGAFGAGVLADAMGDDVRSASAEGVLSLVVGGPACWGSIKVDVESGDTEAVAQGGASTGVGLLADAVGNDTYTVMARSSAEGRALAENTCNVVPSATATVDGGGARLEAQGGLSDGAASLVDLDGDDVYETETSSTTIAEAKATSPIGNGSPSATASGGPAFSYSQAGGEGIVGVASLVDLRGLDTYSNAATSTLTEIENDDTVVTPGATSAGSAATNGACYTNAPPGVLEGGVLGNVAGVGFDGDPAPPSTCTIPPW